MKMHHNEEAAYKDFSFTSYWTKLASTFNNNDNKAYDEDDDLDDEDLDDAEATKTD